MTLAILFEKLNIRTRTSSGTGMTELGDHAPPLGPGDAQLGHSELSSDTTRVLGCYGDVIIVRLFDHEDLLEITEHSGAPIINDLADDAHSCQTFVDLPIIREHVGDFDEVQVAWVGDGNNVGQSLVLGRMMAGTDLTVVTPPTYGIDDDVPEKVAEFGPTPMITTDPEEAVADVDVVYVDIQISMSREDQRHEKLQAFEGFQLNEDLLPGTDAKVMHCLSAYRGEEVTGDALENERSLAWDQVENCLHAQKGLIIELLEE